jgi:subtilisin family serine protease
VREKCDREIAVISRQIKWRTQEERDMAKQQQPRRRRTSPGGTRDKAETRAGISDVKPPIFGEGVSDIIPGEVVIQLTEDTAARVTESISRGPRRGVADAGATAFGISELDTVLSSLKAKDLVRLHPPAPPAGDNMALAIAVPMASTFRLSYSASVSAEQAVERLEAVDGVEFAEPNRYRESYVVPNDPSFAAQWGLTRINAPAAWDRTTGSAAITVAVIDTGVDLDHPELAALLVPGTDMVDLGPNPVPPAGFRFEGDFQGRDNVPQDEVGHGTHVAGTIACLSNNATGVAGVTWSCRLMPVKVLTRIVNVNDPSDVRGTGSAADIAAGIRWAVDHGARVLNLSLGGTTDTQVERDAIAYAISRGAVVVAAMGNAFQQGNPTSFPAAYPNVIAVGAINSADARAPFSQVGPHIDVAAPGVGVLSTVWNNGFTNMSGTSMASPHVAGLAALILSCNSGLTAAQVGDIIRQTARPLRDNPADPIPNNNYGFGCIDAQAAINRACPRRSQPVIVCAGPNLPPSVIVRCPSDPTFLCGTVSVPVNTCPRPSVLIQCQSVPVVTCVQPSVPIATCPQPSALVCPSGPVCGIGPGQPPIGPGLGPAAADPRVQGGWSDDDPYSANYGGGSKSGGGGGCCGGS